MPSAISKASALKRRPETCVYQASGPGTLLKLRNDTKEHMDAAYASLTAPAVVNVEVWLDDRLHDVVYAGAGGSHSWWAQAGGKLLDHNGLAPGETLEILTDGPCALRIDWA